MSMEAMQAFYQKVQSEEALQKEAEQAVQQGAAAVVALAAREGFEFSEAEVAVELAALAAGQEELSDSDLDLVAGGLITQPQKEKTYYGKAFSS
ncbi:putative ribosomally synthesized peptide with nif11-like leader [Agrobacterium vitis]|nr:putative ribosomally synthesized peptide with nif11-like leader [Agrobacterium vitis]MBE1439470.1 putative ribosomally synthesized peptide with nif11-like leader [Agrobacterium vitis]